ncbi:hypothetical protein NECAME_04942 [Necator americanus]|uniref:GDP-D-glucose phosphorylase 1 n=1 Tax=Necator americanus TaxID=51031 RepID=W2SLA4_NECAM|nr:hypothetical protein NECAME_04942 [Necator americanus]ETN70390.1 hypothetical protein NECAME_04942 [Necator americanus]
MRFKNIAEPFNPLRWNFTKLHENEVSEAMIFVLISSRAQHSSSDMLGYESTSYLVVVQILMYLRCEDRPITNDALDRHVIAVNASPLERDHSLIIPAINKCLPQCFSQHPSNQISYNLTRCVEFLTQQNQAHNVFITRAQPIRTTGPEREEDRERKRPQYVTAYVFPRTNSVGAKPPTNFNPAACELAGCLTSYTIRFFESASEQAAVRIIEEEAQLPAEVFRKLALDFSDILSDRPLGTSHCSNNNMHEELTSPEIDELRDTFQMFTPHSPNIANRSSRSGSFEKDSKKRTNFPFANEKNM